MTMPRDPAQPRAVGVQEIIVAAAIMQMGKLYTLPPPHRHHHLIRKIAEETGVETVGGDQGFITDTGRFVGRKQAWRIATEAQQTFVMPGAPPGILFSENLW